MALTTSLETLPHDTHALVWCYAMSGTVVIHGNSDHILQPYVIRIDFTSEVPQVCFVLSFLGTDATLSERVPPRSHSDSSHPGLSLVLIVWFINLRDDVSLSSFQDD